jgi:hypothetical protein
MLRRRVTEEVGSKASSYKKVREAKKLNKSRNATLTSKCCLFLIQRRSSTDRDYSSMET